MYSIKKYSWINYYIFIFILHILGVGGLAIAAINYPALWGLGILAYTLGLRHAFDADHISAIDNTVRKLIHQSHSAYGVGFYFSLGHSTVVLLMSVLTIFSVNWVKQRLPIFQQFGSIIGSITSITFLLVVAIFNIFVLIGLIKLLTKVKMQKKQLNVNSIPAVKGLFSKLLQPLFKLINHDWQMYPIGFLFGLGFDTATEIMLLALTAQSSQKDIPIICILVLPILFMSGMNLMDTTDSIIMSGAYRWAFRSPLKKLYYNILMTTISIIVAVSIGIVELLQLARHIFNLNNSFWRRLQLLNFNAIGIGIVSLFIIIWAIAAIRWQNSLAHRPLNNKN